MFWLKPEAERRAIKKNGLKPIPIDIILYELCKNFVIIYAEFLLALIFPNSERVTSFS